MSVLVQYLKFLKSSPGENEKKEKTAELPGYVPSVSGSIDNEKKDEGELTSSITDHGLATQETPKNINTASTEPVAMRSGSSAAAPAFTQPVANPGRGYNTGVPRPQTQQQPTKIPRVFESIPMANSVNDPRSGTLLDKQGSLGYSRNTGISDVEGEVYVNGNDVELLGKLGFDYSCEEYLGLEKTSEVLDVYSYIEKFAGVPKEVAKLIDAGQAFSGEYLKDIGYSVPKGYEVKGDLVCPVEKTEQSFQQDEKEKKGSFEKTAGSWNRSGDNLLNSQGRVMNNTPNSQPVIENPFGDIAGNVGMNALESIALKGAKKLDPLNKDRMSVSLGNRFAATKALKNVAKAVPGVAAGAGISDAHDRWQKEDYTGAMISGLGAAGDVAQLIPHPVAKGVGLTASWGGTAANAARDINRYNNRPVEFRNTPPSLPQPFVPQNTPILQPLQSLAKQSAADHPVTSSNIKAVGHSKKEKILEVAFHSGGEYKYKDVPRSLYARLLKAKSPGKFLNKHIKKDNKFEYEKVAGMPEHIRKAIITGDKALLQAAQSRSVASRAANAAAKKRKLEIAKLLGAEEPKLLQRGEELQKHFPFSVSHEFEQAKKTIDPSYRPDLSKYLGRL